MGVRRGSDYTQGPCPHCTSSDAYTLYDSGWAECYSCGEKGFVEEQRMDVKEGKIDYNYHPHRGLSERTLKAYKVVTQFVDDKPVETAFPYPNDAYKYRDMNQKKFRTSQGNFSNEALFGSDVFDPGSKESITLTEGEYDALSIYRALQGQTAAVSIAGATTAHKACVKNYDYINSFKKIVLAFDNDEPGHKARDVVMSLFDPKKVYVVDFKRRKDANEYLQKGEEDKLIEAWKGHHKEIPSGIIHKFADIKEALKKHQENKICDYPWGNLQNALHGIHKGEFILFKGLEGIGKTEVLRAIEHHVLKNTDEKLGIIRLEETYGDTIRGLATYELEAPAMMDESGITDEQVMDAYTKIVKGDEDRLFIQSTFDTDDPDTVLGNIRFLVSGGGCSVVVLDHLSMLVTGLEEEDVRKKLDYLVTKLKKMCIQYNFCLISVIHVNDNGQTRDSRYPPKIANSVIHLERDVKHPDPNQRKQTKLIVEKGRGQGCRTGPVGSVYYDDDVSWTLKEVKPYSPEEDDLTDEELEAVA
jgi:twinkle protein